MAWGHPMGTGHREWSGENNEYEYPDDQNSKQNKKLQGEVTHPRHRENHKAVRYNPGSAGCRACTEVGIYYYAYIQLNIKQQ